MHLVGFIITMHGPTNVKCVNTYLFLKYFLYLLVKHNRKFTKSAEHAVLRHRIFVIDQPHIPVSGNISCLL